MKKTLITACALLSSVALADSALTLDEAFTGRPSASASFGVTNTGAAATTSNGVLTGGNAGIYWEGLANTLSNYTLTFSATLNNAEANKKYAFLSTNSGSTGASGLSVTISAQDSTLNTTTQRTITLTTANGLAINQSTVPSLEFKEGTTYTLAVLDNKAYLWEGTTLPTENPTAYVDVTNIASDLVNPGADGQNGTRAWTQTNKVHVTVGTVTVPEPATATLSLLALAGLAARRRRK